MRLSLQRQPSNEVCTIGAIYVNGTWECFTLEPPVREIPGQPVETWKIPGHTAYPAGTYRLSIRHSADLGGDRIHIEDVPGFSEVMIHEGNWVKNTKGCTLAARDHVAGTDAIENSRVAVAALQSKVKQALAAGEPCTIQVLAARPNIGSVT